MNELNIVDNFEIINTPNESNIINSEFMFLFKKNKGNVGFGIKEVLSSIDTIKDIIDPEKTYIVKFPKDILEKMSSGQYDFMKTKGGEILSNIVDKNLPGNRNLVHNLRLEEIDINVAEKVKDLSTNVMNLALQQQLANLTEMLSHIQTLAIDIKRGQVTDRIALVLSGQNQLEQAMLLSDENPNKEHIIRSAMKSLNDGRSQLDLYIRGELYKAPNIPNNKFKILFNSVFISDFYNNMNNLFSEVEEGINTYFKATSLLAKSYEILNSKEALSKVFEPAKELIEITYKKMNYISEIVLDYKENSQIQWYQQPQVLINEIEKYSRFSLPEEIDYISMEFTGNDLVKEAINE